MNKKRKDIFKVYNQNNKIEKDGLKKMSNLINEKYNSNIKKDVKALNEESINESLIKMIKIIILKFKILLVLTLTMQ